jgi:hypothetical protein
MSGRTQTVGSLIVDLRTSSAEFTAEMENARKGLSNVGSSAGGAQRALQNFAVKGFAEVIPGAEALEHSLRKMIEAASKAGGALAVLGQAGLVVGGILAVAAAVQKLQDEYRNWIANGETVAATLKRLDAAVKEEQKFAEDRQKRIAIETDIRKQLLTLQGDEISLIRLATKERENKIVTDVKDVAQRKKLLEQSNVLEAEQLAAARAKRDQDVIESMNKQVEAWKTETAALTKELTDRAKIRADFEAQLGQGGVGGRSALAGLAAATALQTQVQTDMRQLAQQVAKGTISQNQADQERIRIIQQTTTAVDKLNEDYSDMPDVLAQIQKAQRLVDPIGWGEAMAAASKWVKDNIISDQQLAEGTALLNQKLNEQLPATEAAAAAMREATIAYNAFAVSVNLATRSLADFTVATAGTR